MEINQKEIVFKAPSRFTEQYAKDFLKSVEPIFRYKEKPIKNVNFYTKDVERINIFGLLLLYKFFEYTVRKKLFESPHCDLFQSPYVKQELERYGLFKLIKDFVNIQFVPPQYNLQYKESGDFFIAPTVLTRSGKNEENDNIPNVSKYYSYDPKIASVLLLCLSEIKSNFKEHAVEDTKSILMAKGNKKEFSMACADTGEGIISSFKGTKYDSLHRTDLLKKAIERNITSKADSNHMGCGLWIVSEIARQNNGTMYIFSEGTYLSIREGKTRCGECGFWKGTIFYLNLPLSSKIKELSEIICNKNGK